MSAIRFRNLDETRSYRALTVADVPSVGELLDDTRIQRCDIDAGGGLRFNYAAKPVDDTILGLLEELSAEQELPAKYRALVGGRVMNTGEKRRVLHHLLRGRIAERVAEDGVDLEHFYRSERERFSDFATRLRSGELIGSTGKRFDTIVQIGIGGSDLGPRALYLALKNAVPKALRLEAKFISNVDPDDPAEVIDAIDPESTLFILVSKSGTTQETLTNHRFVLEAMARVPAIDPAKHMVAVTSQTSPLAGSDGFLESFFIDDYIGGRYSSTSAVGGVVLSCALGPEVFASVLAGAHEADLAAGAPKPATNAALLDALIGVYERSVLGYPSTAILPYSQALSRFPAHLQQLDMESNGKQVNRDGERVAYPTGPVVFGEPGTNGQHSFYQLLHQGTDIVPLQFIGFRSSQLEVDTEVDGSSSQAKLNANLAAQIVAFAVGKSHDNPNRRFPGNRPSSLLYGESLTPRTVGALLAHYENKVMFQGFAWNLNSFDQEGVQLGKILAQSLLDGTSDDPRLRSYAALLGIGSE
jgi:glucose-6-phosphate isomerase